MRYRGAERLVRTYDQGTREGTFGVNKWDRHDFELLLGNPIAPA